ncbi:hypothetical protein KQX54_007969 [Cotesia glomerata]|uniref:Uncharacterized protein n=1 Tax=Cotesia glomerata TaxID=32391 RepID=A0AAV7IC56_COTGL|nr:hypothetical protein KQX54_007969 [Cotesia glomerata]
MALNQPLFKKGNLFNSYKEFQDRLKLYYSSTGYNFNTRNSTTPSTTTTKEQFNKDIIYSDKYLKCVLNPKKVAQEKFEKENPGYLALRTENVEVLEARHPVSNSLHNQELLHENLISTLLSSTISSDVSNNRQRRPLTLDLMHVETSSIPPVASELADDLANIPVIFEEDFDKLLISLETNIGSTIDKHEQQVKMRRLTEILNKFNGKETEPDKSTLGSLSIHLSQSRGHNKSRRNRVIGLPANGRKNSVESFENSGSELVQPEILNKYFEVDVTKIWVLVKVLNATSAYIGAIGKCIGIKEEPSDWFCPKC